MPHWSNFHHPLRLNTHLNSPGIQQPACGSWDIRTQIIPAVFIQPAHYKKNRALNRGRDDKRTIASTFILNSTIQSSLVSKKASVKKLHSSILRSGKIPLHHRFIDFIIQPEMFHGCFSVDYRHNHYPLVSGARFILLSGTSPTIVTSPLPLSSAARKRET
ncbi:hypothetical protein AI2932V1_3077 [Klebsiella pneumoniae]|nr:hypothetical protein AI2932V1_3077 [Klebsiella pneumoniae]